MWIQTATAFCAHIDPFAAIFKQPSYGFLALPVAVNIGRIDEINALFNGQVQDPVGIPGVKFRSPSPTNLPGPQRDPGNFKSRLPKFSVLHGVVLLILY
jgi:hypothetical protein